MDNAARYAITFAADTEPKAQVNYTTHEFEDLAYSVGNEANERAIRARNAAQDFYPCAFVEQAAQELNRNPGASLEELLAAGQAECESLAF